MMIYKTENKYHRQRAVTRFNKLIEKGAIIEIIEKLPKRTIQQNRYLHLIIAWFGYETGYTPQEVKQYILKQIVCPEIFYDGEVGKIVPVQRWRSTADLDKREFTIVVEKFRNYSSAEAGIYLPEPSDLVALQDIEFELKNNNLI